ncbi:glycosyltransferase family 4 protein [Flavobacterium amniphilum]|uniref:glycosyltransferase family 4 protein n=1 Tax=Flavobacterium amniphilum TaxID=1834035 RepID=UPI002029ED11|nr:glycosyltransferase family 4 protein [Flavobacterium amniphilum]MCL9805091.1 glycosyltransferase family 4 protein [Flavobacterium amniphilum]
MKNLLYIGNKLSGKGLNATTVETLGLALEGEGFGVFYASAKRNLLFRLFDMCWSVVRHRKQVSMVLIDTYSTSAFWYAFFVSQLCRLLRLTYIPILHGGNLPGRLDKNPYLSKLIFKNAYRNVAPSEYLQSVFVKFGFTNVCHIPNSIEISNYKFLERDFNSPKLLWVRAFSEIYNPKMAVDVFQSIKKKYPDAELCMVGPDKDGSLISTRSYAESLDLIVTFTGRLSKQEWVSLSEDFNIFINTTHFDNTPVSIMEAMALGLPVISTNVGGIPFLLESKETALLVQDNDAYAMEQAIELLMQDSSVRIIASNARKKAELWDWKVVKNQWIEILS